MFKPTYTIEERLIDIVSRLKDLEDIIEVLTKDMEGCSRCGSLNLTDEAQHLTDEPVCSVCVGQARG